MQIQTSTNRQICIYTKVHVYEYTNTGINKYTTHASRPLDTYTIIRRYTYINKHMRNYTNIQIYKDTIDEYTHTYIYTHTIIHI